MTSSALELAQWRLLPLFQAKDFSMTSPSFSSAPANKQLMQSIFAGLAQGNGKPLIDAMSDDFCWVVQGQTAWSCRYEGKQVVQEQLFKPLFCTVCRHLHKSGHTVCGRGRQGSD
ncbi:hypothetical protein [Polaromonas sp.]|uniref:hypothetical protein n=1 Tax=Polaromonas sp. TaxID=1869339 RepID=UPI003263E5AC